MPADTYWPFSTLRMPSAAAERGRRCAFWAITAWMRLTGRLRRVALGTRGVEVCLRRHPLLHEIGLARIGDARPPHAWRWRWRGRRTSTGDVELHEPGALLDLRAAFDQHLGDDAGDLAGDVDAHWEARSKVPIEVSCSTHWSCVAFSAVTVAAGREHLRQRKT